MPICNRDGIAHRLTLRLPGKAHDARLGLGDDVERASPDLGPQRPYPEMAQ